MLNFRQIVSLGAVGYAASFLAMLWLVSAITQGGALYAPPASLARLGEMLTFLCVAALFALSASASLAAFGKRFGWSPRRCALAGVAAWLPWFAAACFVTGARTGAAGLFFAAMWGTGTLTRYLVHPKWDGSLPPAPSIITGRTARTRPSFAERPTLLTW
jgi:hypothetical protein